jgi:hypothetical protein
MLILKGMTPEETDLDSKQEERAKMVWASKMWEWKNAQPIMFDSKSTLAHIKTSTAGTQSVEICFVCLL